VGDLRACRRDVLTAACTFEPEKHSEYLLAVSATYTLLHSHGHAVKDEICYEFVANGGLLSIYESGALRGSSPPRAKIKLSTRKRSPALD
jgi:hypothetical protein